MFMVLSPICAEIWVRKVGPNLIQIVDVEVLTIQVSLLEVFIALLILAFEGKQEAIVHIKQELLLPCRL